MAGLQKTLGIVKPDAVDRADEIVERAMRAGFSILNVSTPSHKHTHVHTHTQLRPQMHTDISNRPKQQSP
jgi:nucleoside diphosphate kinase